MLDTIKHLDYFNPEVMQNKNVGVVGIGAIGSMVALQLAKLSVPKITFYDDDTVSSSNISNQIAYGVWDIGTSKTTALLSNLFKLVGEDFDAFNIKVQDTKLKEHVVFCCVDSMAARNHIFSKCVLYNFSTELYLEARMNATSVICYAFDPQSPKYIKQYSDCLYSDADVMPNLGACGVTPSIGATAAIAANVLIWLFMQHIKGEVTAHEVIINTQLWYMSSRKFN